MGKHAKERRAASMAKTAKTTAETGKQDTKKH